MTGEEAKLEERPLGVGGVCGRFSFSLDLTRGWPQSLFSFSPTVAPGGGTCDSATGQNPFWTEEPRKGAHRVRAREANSRQEQAGGGAPSFHTRQGVLAHPRVVGAGSRPGKARPRLGEQNQDRNHQRRPRPTEWQTGQVDPCSRAKAWTPNVGWNPLLAGGDGSGPHLSGRLPAKHLKMTFPRGL